jgi:UDP-glucose 4-epimerase
MRVLVTGAGGFIGSHMVDLLKERGDDVIALDIKGWKDWILGRQRVRYCVGVDVARDDLLNLMKDIPFDACFHLAAESRIQPSFTNPCLYTASNVLGTARILDLCRMNNAKMVYAGSSTADSDVSENVYATTKISGEMLCRAWYKAFRLRVATCRFYNVYGPRQVEDGRYATVIGIWERQYREGKPLTVTGNGMQSRDFTRVSDIVAGLAATLQYGILDGRVYSLGTGETHRLLHVAKMFVGSEIENSVRFIDRPPGEAEITRADVGKTMLETGWTPTRRIQDYIEEVKRDIARSNAAPCDSKDEAKVEG